MLIASSNRLARLQYGPNGFRVLAPGDHVLCAVTSAPIGLDELQPHIRSEWIEQVLRDCVGEQRRLSETCSGT